MERFKLREDEEKKASAITVSNNNFDKQRVSLSTEHSKEVNATYIKQVQKDMTLAEAYNIMMDWIIK